MGFGIGGGRGAGGGGRGWRRVFHAMGLTRWQRLAEGQILSAETADAGGDLESMKRRSRVLERLLADTKARIEALERKGAKGPTDETIGGDR
jgi:hypothetical protein